MTDHESLYCFVCYANYAQFVRLKENPEVENPEHENYGYSHLCPKCRMARGERTSKTKVWLEKNVTPDTSWRPAMKKEDHTKARFVVTTSPHDMPSLVLHNPSVEEHQFIVSAVTFDVSTDPRCALRSNAGAVLQSNHFNYVVVEFRQPDYEPFVQWLNDNYDEWVKFWKLNG